MCFVLAVGFGEEGGTGTETEICIAPSRQDSVSSTSAHIPGPCNTTTPSHNINPPENLSRDNSTSDDPHFVNPTADDPSPEHHSDDHLDTANPPLDNPVTNASFSVPACTPAAILSLTDTTAVVVAQSLSDTASSRSDLRLNFTGNTCYAASTVHAFDFMGFQHYLADPEPGEQTNLHRNLLAVLDGPREGAPNSVTSLVNAVNLGLVSADPISGVSRCVGFLQVISDTEGS